MMRSATTGGSTSRESLRIYQRSPMECFDVQSGFSGLARFRTSAKETI